VVKTDFTHRLLAPYIAARRHTATYVTLRPCACVRAECVDVRHHMQCERDLKTTNDGGTSIQITVLEIIITVLHRLPNRRRAGQYCK